MRIAMTMQNPGEAAAAAAAAAQARGVADGARAQAQAAREQAQGAREQAQAAREDAQAQRDAARERSQTGGGDRRVITITTPDGKSITLSNPSAEALAQVGIPSQSRDGPVDPGPYIVGGISIVSAAVVLLVALTQRYRIKMRGAGPSALPADLTQRLSRMEAGIESVAVEVERISEGQRFTTRLLSDRERVEVPRG